MLHVIDAFAEFERSSSAGLMAPRSAAPSSVTLIAYRGSKPANLDASQLMVPDRKRACMLVVMTDAKLTDAHKWLVQDQYQHGEWGRCESNDPTENARNCAVSKIKPNLFISCQAALALESTGFKDPGPVARFFEWLATLRDVDTGFWTSASGAQGRIEFCADSTHEHAGKTVELPDLSPETIAFYQE